MLPREAFQMRKGLVNLCLAKKGKSNFENLWGVYLWRHALHYLFVLYKFSKNSDTLDSVVNYRFLNQFLLLLVYFYCTWYTEKYTRKVVHTQHVYLFILHCVECHVYPDAHLSLPKFPAPHGRLSGPGLYMDFRKDNDGMVTAHSNKLGIRWSLLEQANENSSPYTSPYCQRLSLSICLRVICIFYVVCLGLFFPQLFIETDLREPQSLLCILNSGLYYL
jgi:hypothetical protein